jgi:hypothetical protein
MSKIQIFLAAFRVVLILSIVDGAISVCASLLGFSARSLFGDLLLFEASVCLIIGGLLDFTKSAGVVELRRLMFGKKEHVLSYSRANDASRSVMTFMIAGLVMLIGTILLVMIDVTLR